jgi:hypothetical protein
MARVKKTRMKSLEAELRGSDKPMRQVASDWEMDRETDLIAARATMEPTRQSRAITAVIPAMSGQGMDRVSVFSELLFSSCILTLLYAYLNEFSG